jgi:hypothetical protein
MLLIFLPNLGMGGSPASDTCYVGFIGALSYLPAGFVGAITDYHAETGAVNYISANFIGPLDFIDAGFVGKITDESPEIGAITDESGFEGDICDD